jgi:hypothetical protein
MAVEELGLLPGGGEREIEANIIIDRAAMCIKSSPFRWLCGAGLLRVNEPIAGSLARERICSEPPRWF